jgi:hypothetical protein
MRFCARLCASGPMGQWFDGEQRSSTRSRLHVMGGPLMQRPGQEALTREVTKDVIAEAWFGRPLCSPPATEIRSVTGDLRCRLNLLMPLPIVCHFPYRFLLIARSSFCLYAKIQNTVSRPPLFHQSCTGNGVRRTKCVTCLHQGDAETAGMARMGAAAPAAARGKTVDARSQLPR